MELGVPVLSVVIVELEGTVGKRPNSLNLAVTVTL